MGSSEVLGLENFTSLLDTKKFVHAIGNDPANIRENDQSIEDAERDLIFTTLKKTGGNKTKAAELLKITTRTLRNKLNKYDMDEKSTVEGAVFSHIP